MDLFTCTLKNGIRFVHLPVKSVVAHCGLFINAGSKNETVSEHGLAHFTEHMLFKGTVIRKPFHILSRLEDVGGELNAYTTKEETVVHASVLARHFDRAIELIRDIVFNSVFPEKEIEKEKEVIVEEINSYRDNPAELIFDDFEEIVYTNQSIGRNILGTKSSVLSFTRTDILAFIEKNYRTDRMVICSVAGITPGKAMNIVLKHFEEVPDSISGNQPDYSPEYTTSHVVRNMDTWQNHCILGNVAYGLKDNRRVGMAILNNILGGQGLNSRLNLSLREKNGFAYNVESVYNPYYETGIFSIYFGTDSHNLEKGIEIANRELKKLRTVRLGPLQLSKAKNQIKGYTARGFENHESLMLGTGKSFLIYDRIDTPDEICRKIDSVTAAELMEIAGEVFDEEKISTLIYK